MYTLDTNAIIYYLQEEEKAAPIVESLLNNTDLIINVSTITEIELFGFPSLGEGEYREIDDLLQKLSIVHVDSQIARIAGSLRRVYGMETPDSAIAATAIFTGSALVTRNVKHFKKVPGLWVQEI